MASKVSSEIISIVRVHNTFETLNYHILQTVLCIIVDYNRQWRL